MISADELLRPVSAEKPCGDDISYDPQFIELETLMRGKPETQFSAAEEPNWKALRERCLELWKKSKDLRVATALALAELKTEGFLGFRESLALLNGLIEKNWNELYPRLDPADGNDPTQRVNIIASLAAPAGTFGDPMKMIERLRDAPLANSVRMGRFGLADILRSEAGTTGPDNKPPPSSSQIQAAFQDTNSDELQKLSQAISDCAASSVKLDELLTNAVGSGKAADLSLLKDALNEIRKRLGGFLGETPGEEAGAEGAPAQAGGASAKAISGDIQSRQDVLRMFDKICQYYARSEPSSPVPFLVKRARRLAEKNFMEIIDDLNPDALEQINKITGAQLKADEAASGEQQT
jgi:type VI secretion system protein ImpA